MAGPAAYDRSGVTSARVLTLIGETQLSQSADRIAAAAGLRVLRATSPGRRDWSSAAAVILDLNFARQCVSAGMPRRDGVVLVSPGDLAPELWPTAIDVGAQHVYALPDQEADLVRLLAELSDDVEQGRRAHRAGKVIAVTSGRGGGGASVFAAALAHCAGEALLVDLDGCGGGIDLLLGGESVPGLRWPDLSLRAGRLNWPAVREVLPRPNGIAVLSATRAYCDIDAGAALAVVDAGRRGGTTVVCDVPRHLHQTGVAVLESADLVVVVTSCDVRSIAATSALVGVVRAVNPTLGLVVRGPAPGGLGAAEVLDVVPAPLLAAMRPEPMLAQHLEQGGLRLRRRSPLVAAARSVLGVLDQRGSAVAA